MVSLTSANLKRRSFFVATFLLAICCARVFACGTTFFQEFETRDESTAPPAWFSDRSEHLDGTFVFVKTEKPFGNPIDAEIALQESCIQHIRELIEEKHPAASSQFLFDWANVSSNFVHKDRCLVNEYSDEHTEELNKNLAADAKYYRGYAQLLVTNDFHRKLSGDWRTQQTRRRLYQIALVMITVICLLTVLFVYLKLQSLTRGFYAGQLKFISLAIAVALIIAFVMLLNSL